MVLVVVARIQKWERRRDKARHGCQIPWGIGGTVSYSYHRTGFQKFTRLTIMFPQGSKKWQWWEHWESWPLILVQLKFWCEEEEKQRITKELHPLETWISLPNVLAIVLLMGEHQFKVFILSFYSNTSMFTWLTENSADKIPMTLVIPQLVLLHHYQVDIVAFDSRMACYEIWYTQDAMMMYSNSFGAPLTFNLTLDLL